MTGFPTEVWVTGMGVVSPLGFDAAETSKALQQGKSRFREIDFFDVSEQRVSSAGVACLPDTTTFSHQLGQREASHLDRGTRILLAAAAEAVVDSKLDETQRKLPIVIGTSAAAMSEGEAYYKKAIAGGQSRCGQFRHVERYQPQRQAMTMSRALGLSGPITIISNACASGANALGHGYHLIASGRHKRVLSGGFDALCQLVFAGFDALQALAPSGIPRPFDADRDGLALGEGGAMLVLESAEEAHARGATPLARLAGYGMALDTHHLTQPHPEGIAALTSMRLACESAKVEPHQVDYLNSHGTGTPLNDVAEALAIQAWAGDAVGKVAVSSTKSATGHSLGGAGALEAAICIMAIRERFVPASLHVRRPDSAVAFDLVQTPRLATDVRCALTNSFGFGGSNASLVVTAV